MREAREKGAHHFEDECQRGKGERRPPEAEGVFAVLPLPLGDAGG